jgi:hypothetical protein
MGFRPFLSRGLDNVQGEWTLEYLAWNLKRMTLIAPAVRGEPREVAFFATSGPPMALGKLLRGASPTGPRLPLHRRPPTGDVLGIPDLSARH